jgi:acyl-CoA reductase-like NAD-dependent aldehyde dehydrogenase
VTPSAREYALLEEYCFVRREAQAEADLAYDDWRAHACRERYAVYRAAQDRADAAQDDLATWVSLLSGSGQPVAALIG